MKYEGGRTRTSTALMWLAAISLQAASLPALGSTFVANQCSDVFTEHGHTMPVADVSAGDLSQAASAKIDVIPEFAYIRESAAKEGVRVWLFGGTAASYLHYVKWDLARQKGLKELQSERFDYDFTNIFRSTQDLDIVIDAPEAKARDFQAKLAARFPHFLGSKSARWEVRTLRTRMKEPGQFGFKEALLGDTDFSNQNSDSNSLGMVEVTRSNEPVVRDLRHWDQAQSPFLDDTLHNRIRFFKSEHHFTTSRAKAGENPEILSVVRLLVKSFQYELDVSDADTKTLKEIIQRFDANEPMNANARRRLLATAKKLALHAVNIECGFDKLDELGLREKLIAMGNKNERNSSAWWLSKEPLRSMPVGTGIGKTAKDLGIRVVAHATNVFQAYESITRAHSGEPNVFISRPNVDGEVAAFGPGFYTQIGRIGGRSTGLTVRFNVNSDAREGSDFKVYRQNIVFLNKKALQTVPESLNYELDDLIRVARTGEVQIEYSDRALLEKLQRKLSAAKMTADIEKLLLSKKEADFQKVILVLSSLQTAIKLKLITQETLSGVARNMYANVEPLSHSESESEQIHYIQSVVPILKSLDAQGLLSPKSFFNQIDNWALRPGAGVAIRKEAAFANVLASDEPGVERDFKKYLSDRELVSILSDIRSWSTSREISKRDFAAGLKRKWSEAIEQGDVEKMKSVTQDGFFDVNTTNVSGYSALLLDDYYAKPKLIDWLIGNREFDLAARNHLGFNQIEQLRLLGKVDLAAFILQKRQDMYARPIHVKERNDDGSPIMAFVKVEPKPFYMTDGSSRVLVTLTKPFEIFSTPTTERIWNEINDLIDLKMIRTAQKPFRPYLPVKVDERLPATHMSFDDIANWIEVLNRLSLSFDPEVQAKLAQIFPGHQMGSIYRLPREAERQFVQRNQGLAEGAYSLSNSRSSLKESAWFTENSARHMHPVGMKRPILLDGHPVYDVQGNAWEWVSDWYGPLTGGVDPEGPAQRLSPTLGRVLCGGGFDSKVEYLRPGMRVHFSPNSRGREFAFRLVRTPPGG